MKKFFTPKAWAQPSQISSGAAEIVEKENDRRRVKQLLRAAPLEYGVSEGSESSSPKFYGGATRLGWDSSYLILAKNDQSTSSLARHLFYRYTKQN